MAKEWAPEKVVTKNWLHSKTTPDPTPNYWTLQKKSYLNKTEKEEDEEEENILQRPPATTERNEAATVEWRRYMMARRQRRKEEEKSRRQRRRLESTQEEALMAKAQLKDLQRQLQRRESGRMIAHHKTWMKIAKQLGPTADAERT